MINLRPHTLRYKVTTTGYEDPVNGDWIPGVTTWSEDVKCRYEPNGKADTISLADGKCYVYSYVIYLDVNNGYDYQLGGQIQLFDNRGIKIEEKQIQGFYRGQLNMKLWI